MRFILRMFRFQDNPSSGGGPKTRWVDARAASVVESTAGQRAVK